MENLKRTQQIIGEYIYLAELKEDYDLILDYLNIPLTDANMVSVDVGGANVPLNAKTIQTLTKEAGEKNQKEYEVKKEELKKSLSSIKFKK